MSPGRRWIPATLPNLSPVLGVPAVVKSVHSDGDPASQMWQFHRPVLHSAIIHWLDGVHIWVEWKVYCSKVKDPRSKITWRVNGFSAEIRSMTFSRPFVRLGFETFLDFEPYRYPHEVKPLGRLSTFSRDYISQECMDSFILFHSVWLKPLSQRLHGLKSEGKWQPFCFIQS